MKNLMLLLSLFVLSLNAYADFGRRDLSPSYCAVKISKESSVAKTEYGRIPFEFVRIQVGHLGQTKISKTFDVRSGGSMSLDGLVLDRIRIDLGAAQMDLYITVGQGKNPNVIAYGLAGDAPTHECK